MARVETAAQVGVRPEAVAVTIGEMPTLTVDGRRLTLAGFRQLLEEQVIAADGTLNGEPIGIVNVHPTKHDCPPEPHRHVVWIRNGLVRRATLLAVAERSRFLFQPPSAPDLLATLIREDIRAGRHGHRQSVPLRSGELGEQLVVDDVPIAAELNDLTQFTLGAQSGITMAQGDVAAGAEKTFVAGRDGRTWLPPQDAVERYTAMLAELLAELDQVNAREALSAVRAEMQQERERLTRIKQARERLLALPQLFIAV